MQAEFPPPWNTDQNPTDFYLDDFYLNKIIISTYRKGTLLTYFQQTQTSRISAGIFGVSQDAPM